MTFWLVPMLAITVVLSVFLVLIIGWRNKLTHHDTAHTTYSDGRAFDLQRRVDASVTASAGHREDLRRTYVALDKERGEKRATDAESAEARAIRVALQADDLDRITENRKRTKGHSGD